MGVCCSCMCLYLLVMLPHRFFSLLVVFSRHYTQHKECFCIGWLTVWAKETHPKHFFSGCIGVVLLSENVFVGNTLSIIKKISTQYGPTLPFFENVNWNSKFFMSMFVYSLNEVTELRFTCFLNIDSYYIIMAPTTCG